MDKIVYIVHCVDTEGPLYETLEATFERLYHIFHIDFKPSIENLNRLRNGLIPLNGIETAVQNTLKEENLEYNESWYDIDNMLDNLEKNGLTDTFGGKWIVNWFCTDHIGYELNPRHRDIGYHNIFDHYVKERKFPIDNIHFHYHPHPIKSDASLCATHWFNQNDKLYQILSRRIIDRLWFPSCNRPGFQVNRPDSHWFLEQYIPFDYANLSMKPNDDDSKHRDFSAGRSGDWRRAPLTWTPYHPSHDDYQVPGICRRWIIRCLNVGSRSYLLNEEEVDRAFREADSGKPVILSFAGHDFRNIMRDIDTVNTFIKQVSQMYPSVSIKYCNAVDAVRMSMKLKEKDHCDLHVSIESIEDDVHTVVITSDFPTFGPQPFFCFKTKSGQYFHDNLDFQKTFHKWTYTFDKETLPLCAIESIGIATNNEYGRTTVVVIDPHTKKEERRVLH